MTSVVVSSAGRVQQTLSRKVDACLRMHLLKPALNSLGLPASSSLQLHSAPSPPPMWSASVNDCECILRQQGAQQCRQCSGYSSEVRTASSGVR